MKVLMSAYACRPGLGSEPGVGWNWAVQASRDNEVWVITPRAYQIAIEEELERSPNPNLHFVYHTLPRPWSLLLKHRDRLGYPHYYAWQASALFVARRLHAQVGFDVAHHVTYAGYRFPSFLLALGIPSVWGPVGGGAQAPVRFFKSFGLAGAIEQLARLLSNAFAKIDPLLWLNARRASLIVADSPATAAALPFSSKAKTVLESQDGLQPDEVPLHRGGGKPGMRAAYIGRLLYWKGVHLGIEALAEARKTRQDITLTLLSRGEGADKLRAQAERLGVAGAVEFAEELPRQEALERLSECDCLLLPSFQDSGGPFAVLEAMSAGLPVICLNMGGPALTVTDETGIRVDVESPEQVIRDLSNALLRLAEDPELRESMGAAGRRRVQEKYLWDRKAGVANSLYARALHVPTQLTSVEGSVGEPDSGMEA
jgi:glycosyltransferase involved in cell wall biosynthesis